MKAIVYNEYGGPEVLKIQEVNKPVPNNKEVLVRIHAVSVNFGDLIARNFRHITAKEFNMLFLFWGIARLSFGVRKPRIRVLGNAFAGEIESVGSQVNNFRKGDAVFGYTGEKMGAYAEYVCMSANGMIAPKPSEVSFEAASVLPYGAIMALNLLRKVTIQPGQKVLVVGASGSIGSAAVQLLKNHFGAEVTGVCGPKRMAFVKSLGADPVLNYETDDYTQSGNTFDFIFDVVGKKPFSAYKSILNKNGTCLYASFKTRKLLQMGWTALAGNRKVICALAMPKADDLTIIKTLVETGKIKSVIDKTFPLDEAAEAHAFVETTRGIAVLKIA